MNLATRCPRCATTFKVQEVQLAASEGHVRCGRCDTVFDARQSLFDLDTGEALDATPVNPPDAVPEPASEPQFDEPEPTTPSGVWQATAPPAAPEEPLAPAWIEAPVQAEDRHEPAWDDTPVSHEAGAPPAAAPSMAQVNERMNAMLGASPTSPEGVAGTGASSGTGAGNLDAWSSLRDSEAAPGAAPSWRRMGVWLLVAVLGLGLPSQWAWSERAALRAKSPGLDAAMTRLCPSCSNAPWQHLEGLSVSASGLQPTAQGGAYRLSVTLQNRAPHTLALPWVELRLSDGSGRPVLRRVIGPQELGVSVDRLAGGGTVQLAGTFRLPAGTAISGYEIGLFHP